MSSTITRFMFFSYNDGNNVVLVYVLRDEIMAEIHDVPNKRVLATGLLGVFLAGKSFGRLRVSVQQVVEGRLSTQGFQIDFSNSKMVDRLINFIEVMINMEDLSATISDFMVFSLQHTFLVQWETIFQDKSKLRDIALNLFIGSNTDFLWNWIAVRCQSESALLRKSEFKRILDVVLMIVTNAKADIHIIRGLLFMFENNEGYTKIIMKKCLGDRLVHFLKEPANRVVKGCKNFLFFQEKKETKEHYDGRYATLSTTVFATLSKSMMAIAEDEKFNLMVSLVLRCYRYESQPNDDIKQRIMAQTLGYCFPIVLHTGLNIIESNKKGAFRSNKQKQNLKQLFERVMRECKQKLGQSGSGIIDGIFGKFNEKKLDWNLPIRPLDESASSQPRTRTMTSDTWSIIGKTMAVMMNAITDGKSTSVAELEQVAARMEMNIWAVSEAMKKGPLKPKWNNAKSGRYINERAMANLIMNRLSTPLPQRAAPDTERAASPAERAAPDTERATSPAERAASPTQRAIEDQDSLEDELLNSLKMLLHCRHRRTKHGRKNRHARCM